MTLKHQTFVTEMLRHGDKARAYKAAYPKAQGKALISAANRLMAHPAIAHALSETHNRIRTEAEAEVKEQVKEELLSLNCIKQLLTNIARGTHTAEKQARNKEGGYEAILVKPSIPQQVAAMRLYCKIEGWHTPANKATTAQPAPKKPAEPNPYLEEFRRIRRETAPKQEDVSPPAEASNTQAAQLPVAPQQQAPFTIAENIPAAVASVPDTPKIQLPVPTTGYTILSELIQDAWDIYIRNQNAKTWRRYQDLLRINKRSTTQPERIALCKTLGLQCHPQDFRYYKSIHQTALHHAAHNINQGRHVERS